MADEQVTPRPRRAYDVVDEPVHDATEPLEAVEAKPSRALREDEPVPEPFAAAPAEAVRATSPEPVTVKGRDGSTVVARRSVAPPRRRWRALLGSLLIAFGICMLGWIGWQYFGTNITSNQAMASECSAMKEDWASGSTTAKPASSAPVPGDAIALLRIPALGNDAEYPVVAGTEDEQLAKGVGWYTSTAQPGQIGNFAVAGHRITHGEPFARLLELNKGDKVIVETRTAIYTYELTTSPRDLTVKDNEGGWVLWPVPDKSKASVKPTEALITLTTCTDLFASPERSVAFGKLVETKNK